MRNENNKFYFSFQVIIGGSVVCVCCEFVLNNFLSAYIFVQMHSVFKS